MYKIVHLISSLARSYLVRPITARRHLPRPPQPRCQLPLPPRPHRCSHFHRSRPLRIPPPHPPGWGMVKI